MKKTLFAIIAAIAISSVAMAQFTTATVENAIPDLSAKSSRTYTREWPHIGTPFTMNDIYGNSVSLQSYLDSGKFVVIDYSCTWCGPCWNLHISGMLEQINALPNFQVIWVESESTNSTSQIFGTSGGSGRSGSTQGNWTRAANGDSITYPIIDDDANSTCLRTCAALYQGSVPTLMLVTPDGLYTNLVGYFSYQQVATSVNNVRAIANNAPTQSSVPQCKISPIGVATTGSPVNLRVLYNTAAPITNITWTIADGTPSTATGENVVTTFNTNGTHRVIVQVSNANGSDYDTISITSRTLPANVLSYTYGGSNSGNVGSNSSGSRTWAVSFPPELLSNFPQLHHVETWINGSSFPASYKMTAYSGTATEPQTQIGEITVNVTSSMGNGYVSFTPATPITVDQTKTLWIVMNATSTRPIAACAYTGNPNSDWLLNNNAWQHGTELNLNCSWLINAFSSANGISLASDNEVRIFPNPATDNVSIMAYGVRYVDVIDMSGNTVMKVNDAKTINLGNLSSGVYMFRIVTDNGVAMKKVVKK